MKGAWIRISLCDVPGLLGGAVEVETRSDHGSGLTYYVGREEEHGETVVRPVDGLGTAIGPDWEVDGSVLDGIELIQAGAGCRYCEETGKTEQIDGRDLAAVTMADCEDCFGLGWVQS